MRRLSSLSGQQDQNRAREVEREVQIALEPRKAGFGDPAFIDRWGQDPPFRLRQNDLEQSGDIPGLIGAKAAQNRHRPGARERQDGLGGAKTRGEPEADEQGAGGDQPGRLV